MKSKEETDRIIEEIVRYLTEMEIDFDEIALEFYQKGDLVEEFWVL